jgi:thiamine-phosphate pyrophosphorylase
MKIAKLHLITQEDRNLSHLDCIKNALSARASWIQLRIKNKPIDEVEQIAKQAKLLCNAANCTLILNDYPDLVRKLDLDGVHLGLTDMDTAEARKLVGKNRIIGGTANTIADIQHHITNGVNYIGYGPFRFTNTKEKLSPIIGLEGYETLEKYNFKIPIIAIGGIKKADIKTILKTTVHGIALASEINLAPQPKEKYEEIFYQVEN